MRFSIWATLLIFMSTLAPPVASIARAESPRDLDIPGGHFYTQTSGRTDREPAQGYAITDADGIPFWTFFRQHGGVDVLGYPISQRFLWDGYVCQATQRAVMQWDPATHQLQLVNIFDYLSDAGKDDWLLAAHIAPRPQRTPEESAPLPFLVLAHYRFRWLYTDPSIFHRYFSTPSYYTIYGLPTSPIVDMGPYYAARFQRAVLYHWKERVPWADDHGTSVGLAGDLLKEVGLIPTPAARPRSLPWQETPRESLAVISSVRTVRTLAVSPPPPVDSPRPVAAAADRPASRPAVLSARGSRRGPVLVGVSTWYGSDFQGRRMSNGRPYNMWNPHTAAANAYPLGTWIRVTRLSTGKSIVVEVTDHGAFRYPNVADLSYAAFAELADPSTGVIQVQVEPVEGPD